MEKAAAAKEKEKERKEAAAKAEERPDFGDLRALKREIHDFGSKAFDKKTGKRDKVRVQDLSPQYIKLLQTT